MKRELMRAAPHTRLCWSDLGGASEAMLRRRKAGEKPDTPDVFKLHAYV